MALTEFNVGDTVEVINGKSENGKITQIKSDYPARYCRYALKGLMGLFSPGELRLVRRGTKRLQVGQRVRATKGVHQGHTGLLVADDRSRVPYQVEIDNGGYHWFMEDYLEAVEEPVERVEPIMAGNNNINKYLRLRTMAFEPTQTQTPRKESIMRKLSVIARKTLDKDLRTLVEHGILNDDLTVENGRFVLDFLANQFRAELAAAAREVFEDDESKRKGRGN